MQNAPVIRLEGLCKSFGPVKANRNISLTFRPGRIKALLGENGAGKSTLMSMLAGRTRPDSGRIFVGEKPVRFASPKEAFAAGIGMVYQHFMLVGSMSVAENVLLGQEGGFFLRPRDMERRVAELAERFALEIDPKARVGALSMGERQRVEILKLLHRDSSLLIFDEPTAVLTPRETDRLFAAFARMTQLGKSVVFISHKLQEVMDTADEIAVLRRGEIVDEFERADLPDTGTLAARMLGRSVESAFMPEPLPVGEEVLRVAGLSLGPLRDISLTLRKGEVLAIAGVAGNGQKELVEVLAGLAKPPRGAVEILGQDWRDFYPTPPKMGGMAYIPEDRRGLACCLDMPLVDNLLLTARETFTDGMFLSRGAALAATLQIISGYDIRPGDPLAPARSLSGGNLQKLVIGRELLRQPAVIIAENPTQGLDVAATDDVHRRLAEARKQAGILLVSGDMGEALRLGDRIAVMFRGKILDCFPKTDLRKMEAVGLMMAGILPGAGGA